MLISEWYVVRVKSGEEEEAKELLKSYDSDVKILSREYYWKSKGQVQKKYKKLFPGYIFVISDLNYIDFDIKLNNIRYQNGKIYKNLKYDNTGIPALSETEKTMICKMTGDRDNDVVESSVGFIEGDRVRIVEGPLFGLESNITYINRHKRIARLSIDFLGELREIVVPLEIVAKY